MENGKPPHASNVLAKFQLSENTVLQQGGYGQD